MHGGAERRLGDIGERAVTRATGQTPPISASAMSSAASAFMRRRMRMTSSVGSAVAAALARLRQQRRKRVIGIAVEQAHESARHRAWIRSQRYGAASAMPPSKPRERRMLAR